MTERRGELLKVAFERACSHETPTTEAELEELTDFTSAELNRRVGRAGLVLRQRVSCRHVRLPHSLLGDDYLDPHLGARDSTYDMRQSEAMRLVAARGCTESADRR